MSRVANIFKRVRRTLADTREPYRHSDEDFLDLLNDALDDISVKTMLFRGSYDIQLQPGVVNYRLPTNLILLENVIYEGKDLPIKDVDYMNRKVSLDWRSKTSEAGLECVVFDQEDVQYIQVYPRLIGDNFIEAFDLEPDVFGVGVSLDGYESDMFGVISNILDNSATLSSQSDIFGVVVAGQQQTSFTIEYKRAPDHLTSVTDDLPLPYFYDKAIKYYIAGHVLRDDRSEQNRTFGSEELNLYRDKLMDIVAQATSDNMSSSQKDTYYNGMG